MADLKFEKVKPQFLQTSELASILRVEPQTIRRNHCVQGHHLGAKPMKMANGRLLWKVEDLEAIISKGRADND